jgi:molybdenum cofactor guanylyltransferase
MSAPWQALILAGGRSTRMGADKATLTWRGRPLLDHLVGVLTRAGASAVHIAGRQPDGRGIADRWPDLGPLGGLASVLPAIDDGVLLVLPVDLPLLDAAALQPLLAGPEATALRYASESLPLRLRVDAATRATMERLVASPPAQRSLNRLFAQLRGVEIALPDTLRQALLNCNTPADWQRAVAASATTADAHADTPAAAVVHQPER